MFLVAPFRESPQVTTFLRSVCEHQFEDQQNCKCGKAHKHLNGYLVEFMWPQKHNNPFIGILKYLNGMAEHFPPS